MPSFSVVIFAVASHFIIEDISLVDFSFTVYSPLGTSLIVNFPSLPSLNWQSASSVADVPAYTPSTALRYLPALFFTVKIRSPLTFAVGTLVLPSISFMIFTISRSLTVTGLSNVA